MTRTIRTAAALLAVALVALPVPVPAQTPATPPAAGSGCLPGRTDGPPCPSLTEKLDRTDGIIRPPAGIDPEIRNATPPDPTPGTTPVIPPSALPDQQPPSKL